MTEVWFRDPLYYIKECAQLVVPNIIWNAGVLARRSIDAQRFLELHYPSAIDYRILVKADGGTYELRRGSSEDHPYAVYPTWRYGEQTFDDLREYLQNPVGENHIACADMRLDPRERPVFGQEHRVIIDRWPDGATGPGRAFLRALSELQEEYPNAIIHLHNGWSYRYSFGMGFRSSDVDPGFYGNDGKIVLGSGRVINHNQANKFSQWVSMFGMTLGELDTPSGRMSYNIKSAQWASKNWNEDINFRVRGPSADIDPTAPYHLDATTRSHMTHPMKQQPGDMIQCDTCSLTMSCKLYRDGAVCTVPKSEPDLVLGRHFRSRDSFVIVEGIGRIMEMEAERILEARELEKDNGGALDPELTKASTALVKQGVVLAKLVDPMLAAAGATRVNVQINQNSQQASAPNANALTAQAIAALEAQGHSRANITVEMVTQYIVMNQKRAIEASSHE